MLTALLEVFPTFGLLILAGIAFHLLLGHLVSKVAKQTLYLYKYLLLKCFHSISLSGDPDDGGGGRDLV